MRRAATVLIALALLAPSFPLPLIAEETGTTTPAVEDSFIVLEPVTEETLKQEEKESSIEEIEEGTSIPAVETPETLFEEAPPEELQQAFLLQSSGGPVIFSNISTAEPITKIEFSGGAYRYLSQELVAQSSGVIAEVDLYVSQYSGGTDRSLRLEIYDETGTVPLCLVLNVGESYAPGPNRDGWGLVPFAEAQPEFVTFPEAGISSNDCELVEGETYTVKLGISASSINGTVRLYTAGDLPEDFYIVARREAHPPPVCTEDCFSNVLFLPGIQGSALREGNDLRWPSSLFSEDVARLAIDEDGQSVNDIEVAGVMGDFVPGTDIYGEFSTFMDSLITDQTINEWTPYAYDWRLPLQTTLEEGSEQEPGGEVVKLIEEIERLAQTSKSGKVAIVAHSMGGLLGKLLIQRLEVEGKENLIDNFIMVGTPQLGTPQAAATLLHGHQKIPMEFFSRSHVTREIAQNMQTAYDLLPSERYFAEIIDPVLRFNESADFTQEWIARWGTATDEYSEFTEFMTGTGIVREKPEETNLAIPEVVREELYENAEALHDSLDTYVFPENIRVVQIAGWGLPTLKGVEYKKKHIFFDGYDADFTLEGDNTVVYASALFSGSEEYYYFNLDLYNALNDTSNYEHRNLAGAPPIQNVVTQVLQDTVVTENEYISPDKPNPSDVKQKLLVSTKSPVILGAYDEFGNFTGINPSQDLASEALAIEQDIPDSTFIAAGEDLYLFLPKEGSYTFVFVGTGNGPATLEIGTFTNDTLILDTSYSEIPVTPTTKGTFEVSSISSEVFIEIDNNDDGQTDVVVAPDDYVPPPTLAELIGSLKTEIQTLEVKEKVKMRLIKKVEKIEKKIAKNKTQRASRAILNLENRIAKKVEKGRISSVDAESILDLLNQIEDAL